MIEFLQIQIAKPITLGMTCIPSTLPVPKQKPPIEDNYQRLNRLGSGSYGTVYLALRKHSKPTFFERVFQRQQPPEGQYLAVKVYRKPDNNWEGIDFSCLRQITCMQAFSHPNVVHSIQVVARPRTDIPHINEISVVMDFHLELQDLLIPSSSQSIRKRAAKQVTRGLCYLHENFIFHRDLKPENIFVSRSGLVKLADFGFAKEFGTPYRRYTINACTMEYRAPEIFFGTHYYTQKADIWSLGCVFAYIFTGKPLFRLDNKAEIQLLAQMFYLAGTPTEQSWPFLSSFPLRFNFRHEDPKDLSKELNISQQIGELISRCLQPDPRKRPSAAELLMDPVFKDVSDANFDVSQAYDTKLKKLLERR